MSERTGHPVLRANFRILIHFISAAAFAIGLALLVTGAARAEIEHCPVSLGGISPIGVDVEDPGGNPPAAATYAIVLKGLSERNAEATLALHTHTGWFAVDVPKRPLKPYREHWRNGSIGFDRVEYFSDPFYVTFPSPVILTSAFVNTAEATDESRIGWSGKGRVTCAGSGGENLDGELGKHPGKRISLLQWTNQLHIDTPPSIGSENLTPIASSAPGALDCEVPFREALVTALAPAQVEEGVLSGAQSGVVFVQVSLSASGKPDDAWVFATSGNVHFDIAAVRAAKVSTYLPKRAFCQNVPSQYIFRLDVQE